MTENSIPRLGENPNLQPATPGPEGSRVGRSSGSRVAGGGGGDAQGLLDRLLVKGLPPSGIIRIFMTFKISR